MSAPSLQEYQARPPHPSRRQGGWRLRSATCQAAPSSHAKEGHEAPLVSIVTVVHNGQATLERAIRSVVQQTYPRIEYVIIDGGSTDGTLEIIQRYEERIAVWLSEPDAGIFDAMNKGLALASGDYVAILNCDDYYLPQTVEFVVQTLQQQRAGNAPGYSPGSDPALQPPEAVYGDSIFVLEDIGMEGRVTATTRLARGMTLCHPALFVARSVYERFGGYDLNYKYSSDLDFALRIYLAKVKFEKAAQPLAYFTAGGAAERHLARASWEAMAVLKRQAGVLSAAAYALMFLKRALLRTANWFIGRLFGRRAFLWVKRRYYAVKGFKNVV